MAFGKKDKDEQGEAASEEAVPALVPAEGLVPQADTAPELLAPEPAPAPAEAAAPGADLLSMFQTTESGSVDNSTLLELAGEHEIDDLLEELHTVAAALGIVFDDDLAA